MRSPRAGFLSPVVRRLVAEHDLDPAEIEGSGAGGRVTRDDVLTVVAARASAAPDAPAAAAVAPPVTAATAARSTAQPLSTMRRRIAEHMLRSQVTSAHAFTSVEVDFEAVDRVRRANGERWRAAEGFALTYLPFVARAVVDAIRSYPMMNASVTDDGVLLRESVHLGVAVDLDFEGLVVPVLRDADMKRLRRIARDVSDLAARARARTLTADDLAGGTITLTNPGPFGTWCSVPIINQPQVAIVVTDGVRREPVVVPCTDSGEGIAVHAIGTIGVSFDQRAVGIEDAAAFLGRVRESIETRNWQQELGTPPRR